MTSLHRIRSPWLADRTARRNLVCATLRELGFVIPVGARHVVPQAWALLENSDSPLPDPSLARLGKGAHLNIVDPLGLLGVHMLKACLDPA